MKQYKVYKHPSGSTEAVKQGWSWPGFFFSFIWAMVKKMWGLGVGVLIGFFILGFIIGAARGSSGGAALINVVAIIANIVVAIIANIIFGVHGNSWREKNLASRGFEQVDTVTAANPEGAIALYLKSVDTKRDQRLAATPSSGTSFLNVVKLIVRVVWVVSGVILGLSVVLLLKPGTEEKAGEVSFWLLIWFIGSAIYIARKKLKK